MKRPNTNITNFDLFLLIILFSEIAVTIGKLLQY